MSVESETLAEPAPDAWPYDGLEDDFRPRMAALLAAGEAFGLVTVTAADGGPRGVGAQMVVTKAEAWGFVSGGCIEADVALHARATLADGAPRHLVYGRGSPWFDMPLPCGGRLDLLAERIDPADPTIADLVAAQAARRSVRYLSDGHSRRLAEPLARDVAPAPVDVVFEAQQRLIVFGMDPIALAMAALASRMGWLAVVVWPDGPETAPEPGINLRRDDPVAALAALAPDPRTAIAVATHRAEDDARAILAALRTRAGYIGVLGARRRIPERLAGLRAAGADEASLSRLHMPIGLPLGAATPWEIALSVAGEIVAARRGGKAWR